MAGFPQIPEIRGDTDDDASIHLFSRIGPSKPLARQKYDNQIMDILHGESSDGAEADFDAQTLNAKFEKFAKQLDEDSDSDTQVEGDDFKRRATKQKLYSKKRTQRKETPPNTPLLRKSLQLPVVFISLGFIVGLFLIAQISPSKKFENVHYSDAALASLQNRVSILDENINTINKWSSGMDTHLKHIDTKQTLMDSMAKEIDLLGTSVEKLSSQLLSGQSYFEDLKKEIHECKDNLRTLENLSKNPEVLQQRVNEITSQLSKLSKITENFNESKNSIIAKFVETLPKHIPIYMKDGQIHYLPEFQKFLFQFIDTFDKSNPGHVSWESFLSSNEKELSQYIQNIVHQFADKIELLPREDFEEILSAKLASHSSMMKAALNDVIAKLDLSRNITKIDVSQSSNKVVLDGLIDIIGKGSLKVNYADYKLGARILGFLTNPGRAALNGPSLARRILLGWYDYFSSSSISAYNQRFNANTVLVDDYTYWQCASSHCSVGIRLSSPIILTDLILRNPGSRPEYLKLPTTVSIFVKPKRKHQIQLVEEYTKGLDFQEKSLSNKYASKFLKIQEVHLDNPSQVEHIKLPVSLINLKILVRDLYVEIKSDLGTTGLANLKAYGLTEYNSLRLNEDFESLLDILGKEQDFNRNLLYFDDDEIY